ncbi:hypothetical protein B7P43_G07373 [Cryptotermes secundus]|uniref:Pickpocket protein 28 n=1 Tax=Cryptotermes secundus TaxID=105785 RepID=A0A2J7PMQ8_9NEOP|nr:hypothetical protein B7P43_G07373 [Cryptotermes secundus]
MCHVAFRLFWTIAFILATMTAGYFIKIVYAKWDDTPVIVSIAAKTTQLVDIPFPAVTLCTMNEARKSEAEKIKASTNESDVLFKKLLSDSCENSDSQKPVKKWNNNTSISWENIQNFMVKVRQPCHEMLKVCYYAGVAHNCSDIFNPSLTDEGLCCSFNKAKRDYIFRNPRNLTDLNLTFPMNATDWNPETGYPPNTPAGALPWRPRGAGTHLGLSVVLDAEVKEFYCSTSASIGFKLLLHNPVETPKIADYGLLLAPGREYRIKITPTINNAAKSLHNLREIDRQCAYSADKYLLFYKTYTQRNCMLECEANYTFLVCNCVPFYLPKDINTPICGKEEEGCTKLARKLLEMTLVEASDFNSTDGWPTPNCKCLPGCNELGYSSSMTYGHMIPSLAVNKGYMEDTVHSNNTGKEKDLTVVHLYFTETQFFSYYKTEIFGLSEFLSSTGGLLGLFIGFSFLSAVEVLYFATVRLWCGIVRRRKKMVDSYPFVK